MISFHCFNTIGKALEGKFCIKSFKVQFPLWMYRVLEDDPSPAKSIGHYENIPRVFSFDVLPASFFGIRFELFHYSNSNQAG